MSIGTVAVIAFNIHSNATDLLVLWAENELWLLYCSFQIKIVGLYAIYNMYETGLT